MKTRRSALIAMPLIASALASGCATSGAQGIGVDALDVPSSSTTAVTSRKDLFVSKLSADQRKSYETLAIHLGASLGHSGNPMNALAARVLSLIGK